MKYEPIKIKAARRRNAVCAIKLRSATFQDKRKKRNKTRLDKTEKAIKDQF